MDNTYVKVTFLLLWQQVIKVYEIVHNLYSLLIHFKLSASWKKKRTSKTKQGCVTNYVAADWIDCVTMTMMI